MKSKTKILVVDDETVIRELLCDILNQQGYETIGAEDGEEALRLFWSHRDISLVILDIMMPKCDGWEVLEQIHRESDIPVIVLTALDNIEDELKGLNGGAIDYISKPFSYAVLIARVKVALKSKNFNITEEETICFGDIVVNNLLHQVYVKGKEITLNNKEYQLLLYLINNEKIVLDREKILMAIWGYDYDGTERTIDTHIKMLRGKLGECGNYIKTLRGSGYYFNSKEEK